MLFRKSQQKRWSPTVVLTVGALTVIGAVTLTNAARTMGSKIKSKLSSMCSFGRMNECCCSDDEDEQY